MLPVSFDRHKTADPLVRPMRQYPALNQNGTAVKNVKKKTLNKVASANTAIAYFIDELEMIPLFDDLWMIYR